MRLVILASGLFLLSSCSGQIDPALDPSNMGAPGSASNVHIQKSNRFFGKQESAITSTLRVPLKDDSAISHYEPKLLQNGWIPCNKSSLHGEWGRFIDATQKKTGTQEKLQYVAYFVRAEAFAQLHIEQTVQPHGTAKVEDSDQTVMLRISSGWEEKCPT